MSKRAAEHGGPRPQPRSWLWVGTGALCLLALLVGMIVRAGTHAGGASLLMAGLVAAAAILFLAGEIVTVLQAVQAREAARAALAALPPGHRVSGRVRVRGAGRPVVVDHLVVRPDGAVFAVTIDGSTNPPRVGDPAEGLGRLLPAARHAAEVVQRAARAGVLPAELGLPVKAGVRPCILAARRPLSTGERDGVLTFSANDVVAALAAGRGGRAGDRPAKRP